MSGGEVRKVSRQDIQLVQNLIERCLQLYMNQKEVVDTLSYQAKIEPSFTELVWQKLEEENREFFKAYYVRLMLKNQITVFNKLLEHQYRLMTKEDPSGASPLQISDESTNQMMNQNACYFSEAAPRSSLSDAVQQSEVLSGGHMNGGSTSNHLLYANKDVSALPSAINASTSILTVDPSERFNGMAIKTETNYSTNSDYAFCNENALLDSCPLIEDASGASFGSSDHTGQPLNELEAVSPSFGFLSHIPRNFSFSDLADDFNQSSDILESYGRSPFLQPEPNNFSESAAGNCKDIGSTRLDTISEGGYDGFGSE